MEGSDGASHPGARKLARFLGNQLAPGWDGLKDGICFHRCVVYFVHNDRILVKVGHCLGLNGGIFLGSIAVWNYGVSPLLSWILELAEHGEGGGQFSEGAKLVLSSVFLLTWLLPVYLISFPLSCMWYQQIAEMAHTTVKEKGAASLKPKVDADSSDVLVQVAQELYRMVLFAVFLFQTTIAGFIPLIGVPVSFVLLSWLNALYSFDYKWSLSRRRLEERIKFFELHWAFFAGFGSVCTMLSYVWAWLSQRYGLFWPVFSDAAFLALFYPLLILVAADAKPEAAYLQPDNNVKGRRHEKQEVSMSQLPIFKSSVVITSWIISSSPDLLQMPRFFWEHRWKICLGIVLACSIPAAFQTASKAA